jgi:predicted  nucleic acid-binding Zn-ribbon protein
MRDKEKSSGKRGRMPELERELQDAKDKEAAAERRATETLKRAEQLEDESRKLGEEAEKIRKKAAEPIEFLPPPTKGKGTSDHPT